MANRIGERAASYRIKAVQDENRPELPSVNLELHSARRILVDKGSRGAGAAAQPMEVRNDELVKVVFDDQHHLWLRADELRDLHGSVPESRGPGDENLIELDLDGSESGERGLLSTGIKALEFFGVDLKRVTAGKLGGVVDAKRLLLGQEALYRCRLNAPKAPLSALDASTVPGERPLLVFIHGTFSNFVAAYGGLMSEAGDEAGRAAAQLRAALQQQYGEHVFAFEHQTLTRSPVQNAQVLVDALPVDAELHLVTHSRGGLIGELLALAERVRQDDRLETLIVQLYEAADPQKLRAPGLPPLGDKDARALAQAYREDARRLRALVQSMDRKRIRVRRFVRVACPARGTTLASARLDRWLGLLQSVVPESFVGDALDFLLAVLKERTDARVMPGIEAMMPGSALTRLLNAGIVTDADLSVIAGDTQGSGFFNRLKAFVADWFYGAENDLVVNTGSMSGGLARPPGKARSLEDRGSNVTHGRYFLNPGSLGWLRSGLLRADADAGGYADILLARREEPRARGALARGEADLRKRPIVVFLPGAMGSALWVGEEEIWVNHLALLMGGMSRIAIDATVRASEPLEDFYGPLIEYLAREYRVNAVPYDWRQSVAANAQTLLEQLAPLVKRAEDDGVALHIVAHSMGGLVARCLIADQAEGQALWQRIGKLSGGPGRLLMLGTPNHGSSEAVRWLTGHNPTQAKLAFLDFKHGVFGLMKIVRRFPGLVELLPFGTDQLETESTHLQTWQELQQLCGASFRLVEPDTLVEARKTWARLRAAPVDPERMCYVAGSAYATVVGHFVEIDELTGFKRIAWEATSDGDGTVSWASSELPGLKLWYAPDTSHDELCSNESDLRIFRAYVDLLKTGRTDQLPSVAPASSRGARKTFKLMQPPLDAMPGAADMRRLGLGGTPRRARSAQTVSPGLRVNVRHGNLRVAARHPVVVGHYLGDLLVNAEGAIDRALDGALSQASALGIYPGTLGSSKSFLGAPRATANKAATGMLKGALVLGLGQVGELTASRLRATVRDGMLEHARQAAQGLPSDAPRLGLGFSCLLVGSGDTGLGVRESVESLLRGALDANRKLSDARLDGRVLITELEFIELYEDQAVGAGHALNSVRKARDLETQVQWEPAEVELGSRYGGQRRSQYDTNQSWDQRVEIIEHTAGDGSNRPPGTLSFSVAGQRARADQMTTTGQVALAEAFIEQAISSADSNQEISKTLYEMLLPVDFRLSAPDARGMVLLVDERSARFPWELLEDRWGLNRRPLSVEAGMVRQFKTATGRKTPRMAAEPAVLVIGDPQLSGWVRFGQLEGAEAEARRVAELFRASSSGLEVTALVGAAQASVRSITTALHSRPWRVMHLAAHGVHEYVEPGTTEPRTGMIIGKQVYLQPGDVMQLLHVPELVFINCCDLGKTQVKTAYNELAANLAVAFICMGARAVIAGGWVVGDAAGVTFAETFYRAMIEGDNFRGAVLRARRATYDQHPEKNTWGAYQCYGEPGWRLTLGAQGRDEQLLPRFVSPREAVVELDNLSTVQRVGRDRNADKAAHRRWIEEKVVAIIQRMPAGEAGERWRERGDVAAALGLLYVEAEMSDLAIDALRQAVTAGDDQAPLRALEQLANRRVRAVEKRWQALTDQPPTSADELQARSLELTDELEGATQLLAALAGQTPKRETWCLVGSAHKRRALLARDAEARRSALRDMARAYHRGLLRPGTDDYYPLSNGAAAALLLDREAGAWDNEDPELRPHWRAALVQQLQQQLEVGAKLLAEDFDTWRAVGQGDLRVTLTLAQIEDAAQLDAQVEQVVAAYRDAFKRAGSERNVSSMRRHLVFLQVMLKANLAAWPPRAEQVIGRLLAACDELELKEA